MKQKGTQEVIKMLFTHAYKLAYSFPSLSPCIFWQRALNISEHQPELCGSSPSRPIPHLRLSPYFVSKHHDDRPTYHDYLRAGD